MGRGTRMRSYHLVPPLCTQSVPPSFSVTHTQRLYPAFSLSLSRHLPSALQLAPDCSVSYHVCSLHTNPIHLSNLIASNPFIFAYYFPIIKSPKTVHQNNQTQQDIVPTITVNNQQITEPFIRPVSPSGSFKSVSSGKSGSSVKSGSSIKSNMSTRNMKRNRAASGSDTSEDPPEKKKSTTDEDETLHNVLVGIGKINVKLENQEIVLSSLSKLPEIVGVYSNEVTELRTSNAQLIENNASLMATTSELKLENKETKESIAILSLKVDNNNNNRNNEGSTSSSSEQNRLSMLNSATEANFTCIQRLMSKQT